MLPPPAAAAASMARLMAGESSDLPSALAPKEVTSKFADPGDGDCDGRAAAAPVATGSPANAEAAMPAPADFRKLRRSEGLRGMKAPGFYPCNFAEEREQRIVYRSAKESVDWKAS